MFRKTVLGLSAAAALAVSTPAVASFGPQSVETPRVLAAERIDVRAPLGAGIQLRASGKAAAMQRVAGSRFNCWYDTMNNYNSDIAGVLGNLFFGVPISMAVYLGCS